jgi:hypothetical protein
MLITAGSVTPKTRKGRTATVRPSTILLTSSVSNDSIATARLQRLAALCGVTGRRAELIAGLVWGEAA